MKKAEILKSENIVLDTGSEEAAVMMAIDKDLLSPKKTLRKPRLKIKKVAHEEDKTMG